MISRYMKTKWYKHRFLFRNKSMRRYLPETHLYSRRIFWKLLNRDKVVIIKPSWGSGGKGVAKISKLNKDVYRVHSGNKVQLIKGKHNLDRYVTLLRRNKLYIVQYCIPVATVNGRPLNFRYVVQRKRDDPKWEITGKHGKIARTRYFITNVQVGAKIKTVEDALLSSNIDDLKTENIVAELDNLAYNLSNYFSSKYKSQCIWGFDFAVDIKGNVWLIEANSSPQVNAFRRMKDKSMINKIKSYKAYNSKKR